MQINQNYCTKKTRTIVSKGQLHLNKKKYYDKVFMKQQQK